MLLRFVVIVLASFAVCVLLLMVMLSLIDLNNPVVEPLEAAPVEFFRSRLPESPERLSYRPVRPSLPRLLPPAPAFAGGMGGFIPERHLIICGLTPGKLDPLSSVGLVPVTLAFQPYVVAPAYPGEAWGKDLSGWVLLQFDLASASATVVDHCAWRQEGRRCRNRPDDVFDAAALAAFARLGQAPAPGNDRAGPRGSVYYRMVFELENPD